MMPQLGHTGPIGWHRHRLPSWCHMGIQGKQGRECAAVDAAAAAGAVPISLFLTLWIGRVRGLPAPRDTLASPTVFCRWETPWAAPQFRKGKCQMQPSRLACQDLPLRCWQSCLLKK